MAKIEGGARNDVLVGTTLDDELFGFGGADSLSGGNGSDRLFGGDGADRLSGDHGDDQLEGGAAGDTLHGGAGRDALIGGSGDDATDGGSGVDLAIFTGKRSDYLVTSTNGITTVRDLRKGATDGTDTLTNVERLKFSDQFVYLVANKAPVVAGDTASTHEEATLLGTVLHNDSDLDVDPLVVTSIRAVSSSGTLTASVPLTGEARLVLPSGAAVTMRSDGTYTYDPTGKFEWLPVGQSALDTFEYTVTDGHVATAVAAQVTITITGTNDAPISVGSLSALNIVEGSPLEGFSVAHAFNDIDAGDTLSYTATLSDGSSLPEWLTIDAAGTLSAEPGFDHAGNYSIVITATDGSGAVASQTLDLTVVDAVRPMTQGKLADGYISGAVIFADEDNDGIWDSTEPFTTTDETGTFFLPDTGPLIASGGTNIDTGLANTLVLTAPQGATVVNPITTLIVALTAAGATVEEANGLLAAEFGFTGDLTTFDPLAALELNPNDPVALAAQKTAASLAVLLSTAEEAVAGAQTTVLAALADYARSAASDPLPLTNPAALETILIEAAVTLNVSLFAGQIAAQNTAIASAEDLGELVEAQDFVPYVGTEEEDEFIVETDDGYVMYGLGGNDTLVGSTGDDTIYAGDGDDIVDAGGGTNTADGGDGTDIAYFRFDSPTTFTFTGDQTVSGAGYTSAIQNFERAVLVGSFDADVLTGGSGDDFLRGKSGADVLRGGDGADELSGGSERDTFVLEANGAVDRINDFDPGAVGDFLDLSQLTPRFQYYQSGMNPVTQGYLRFVESEGGALLQLRENPHDRSFESWTDVALFSGVGAATMTSRLMSDFPQATVTIDLPNDGLGGSVYGSALPDTDVKIYRQVTEDAAPELIGTVSRYDRIVLDLTGSGVTTVDMIKYFAGTLEIVGGDSLEGMAEHSFAGSLVIEGDETSDFYHGGNLANDISAGGGADVILNPINRSSLPTAIDAGAGDDIILLEGLTSNGDAIDGGSGVDTLLLFEDPTLTAGSEGAQLPGVTNVEVIWTNRLEATSALVAGADADLDGTPGDIRVIQRTPLVPINGEDVDFEGIQHDVVIDASALEAGESLHFVGSSEAFGSSTILGGSGRDVIELRSAGSNLADAGAGDDFLSGGQGADVFVGGLGRDYFLIAGDGGGIDTISDFETGAAGDILEVSNLAARFIDYDGSNPLTGGYVQFVDGVDGALLQVRQSQDGLPVAGWADVIQFTGRSADTMRTHLMTQYPKVEFKEVTAPADGRGGTIMMAIAADGSGSLSRSINGTNLEPVGAFGQYDHLLLDLTGSGVVTVQAAWNFEGTLEVIGDSTTTTYGDGEFHGLLKVNGHDTAEFFWGGYKADDIFAGGGRDVVIDVKNNSLIQSDIDAGIGDDLIYVGALSHNGDRIDGGGGYDTLWLMGESGEGTIAAAPQLAGVANIDLIWAASLELPSELAATADGNNDGILGDIRVVQASPPISVLGETIDTNDVWHSVSIDASRLTSEQSLEFVGTREATGFSEIIGGAGDDHIEVRASGHSDISAGGGDDTILLEGTGGFFVLGGEGDDVFEFNLDLWSGQATIGDFESGSDRLVFAGEALDDLALGELLAESFALGTAAQDAEDRFIYDQATGGLRYDSDGSGAAAAMFIAHFTDAPLLDASHFFIA